MAELTVKFLLDTALFTSLNAIN